MRIGDIVDYLKTRNQDEQILIAWWERKGMFDWVSQEQWDELTVFVEANMDWSHTHGELSCIFEEYIKEESDD